MIEKEIIEMYRESKNKSAQIGILAELNATRKSKIIGILYKHGEKIPEKDIKQLMDSLDRIEQKIKDLETMYREMCEDMGHKFTKRGRGGFGQN